MSKDDATRLMGEDIGHEIRSPKSPVRFLE